MSNVDNFPNPNEQDWAQIEKMIRSTLSKRLSQHAIDWICADLKRGFLATEWEGRLSIGVCRDRSIEVVDLIRRMREHSKRRELRLWAIILGLAERLYRYAGDDGGAPPRAA